MNKKIIISLAALALVSSTLYAEPSFDKKESQCTSQYEGKKHHKGQHGLMKIFKKLDLNKDQKSEIKSIMQDSRKNSPNPHDAFSYTNFDKKTFVKLAKEKRDGRIQRKADLIEKIYNVLDDSQKKSFKTMLNMKDIMKKKMIKNGCKNAKHCNGRG